MKRKLKILYSWNICIYSNYPLGFIFNFVTNSVKLGMAMLFGAAFGLIIAKAQICFTSAFRDIFTTGRSELAIAIIIGMAVATLGVFTYLNMGAAPKIFGLDQMLLLVDYFWIWNCNCRWL